MRDYKKSIKHLLCLVLLVLLSNIDQVEFPQASCYLLLLHACVSQVCSLQPVHSSCHHIRIYRGDVVSTHLFVKSSQRLCGQTSLLDHPWLPPTPGSMARKPTLDWSIVSYIDEIQEFVVYKTKKATQGRQIVCFKLPILLYCFWGLHNRNKSLPCYWSNHPCTLGLKWEHSRNS